MKISNLLFIVALLILIACNQNNNTSQNAMGESTGQTKDVLQSEGDLLMGVSKAVCYSGYRSGQET